MDARETDRLYREWLGHPGLPEDLKRELEAIRGRPEEIRERFGGDLAFGTGGLRGVMGAGPSRMNVLTVARASAGLAEYLKRRNARPSCAIAFDTRLNSALFARIAAAALADRGVRVHLFVEPVPTPTLSFTVRELQCDAGVVITASHNPAQYNGYKVYGPDGCQIGPETAAKLAALISREPAPAPLPPAAPEEGGEILRIGAELMEAYEEAVLRQSVLKPAQPLHVVYSPLNGTGAGPVVRVLGRLPGIRVTVVSEQAAPDGRFPTCPKPNPEHPEAMALAARLAVDTGADLCLATDPDCDRVGVGVNAAGGVRFLSGNDVGVLLLHFICACRTAQGRMPARPVAVKTIVTAPMAEAVAAEYSVELRDTLTGFKYIGEQIGLLEKEGGTDRFLFGFEESAGYLAGTYVRDKDAVCASMLLCEMASHYLSRGMTLLDALSELRAKYGCWLSRLLSFPFEGADGSERMRRVMAELRASPALGGFGAPRVTDYLEAGTGLPVSDVLSLDFGQSGRVVARPSGTEPLLKAYLSASAATEAEALLRLDALEEAVRGAVGNRE